MSKHTPGPWNVTEVHQSADVLEWIIDCNRPASNGCKEDPRIAIVEEMGGSMDGREEGRSNAHLIASAPDLLEALEALLNWGRDHTSPTQPNSPHQLLVNAHNVIAKARGQT